MNFKSEKGLTGIDITVAVIVLTLFVAIITSLFYSINLTSLAIERKKEATSIAIKIIEELKVTDFNLLEEQEKAEYYKDAEGKETPYYKEIIITDYADMEGNTDKVKGLVKKVTVKMSFKVGKNTEAVEFSIIRKKEN